ncbi:chloride channel protein [Apilactobacillus apisilvae]|uniref:Chloride channel protein n=1 Tax=Apilactobacillus apisilvae TaxID=2923364 RepID=A0ABY4PHF7_9LACO|nr:ClC family H(+)/Cl(-) exchange transporter [Apilactobacillus apisilvae]UQS85090.1 chloride channel protein [Apilactobacillus apisilvae]
MKLDNIKRFKSVLYGALIGVVVGIFISLFRILIEFLSGIFLKIALYANNSLFLLFLLIFINLSLAIITYWLIISNHNIKGSGIPQVEGQLAGQLDYKWCPVFIKKFIGGVLSISSGLFLGREGPSIQLGATLAQGIAKLTHNEGVDRKIMISGGAAAGLSAAFNAPIASTLFVLEEIYHNFSTLVWTIALSAAVASNFISTAVFGKTPVLHMNYFHVIPLHIYPYLIGLGIFLGVFGKLYEFFTINIGSWYKKLNFIPNWVFVFIPFLLVIPIEMFIPNISGGGSNLVLTISKQSPAILTLIFFFLLRFVFSTMSYGTGVPGGIFLPMLSLGAVLGSIYAKILISLGLMSPIFFVNFIIVSMSAYFACISKSPFTAILLITEMVGSLQNLMALAFVTLAAYVVSDLLGSKPIYDEMLQNLLSPQKSSVRGNVVIINSSVFVGSKIDGKMVKNISWPDDTILSSINRNDNRIIPNGDTIIKAGDNLKISTNYSNRGYVHDYMKKLVNNY